MKKLLDWFAFSIFMGFWLLGALASASFAVVIIYLAYRIIKGIVTG
jgi:hypothetical protein